MRRWLSLLLVFLLIFIMIGCSPGENTESDAKILEQETEEQVVEERTTPGEVQTGENADPEENSGALIEGEFYHLEELKDIIAAFAELEYTFEESTSNATFSASYTLLGQETVQGTTADHIAVTYTTNGESTESELWMDKNGNPLKAKMEGLELGEAESSFVVLSLTGMLMPFTMYATMWEDAFLEEDGYNYLGWQLKNKSTKTKNLGAGNVTVKEMEFVGKDLSSNQELKYSYEVAQIGGKAMFIGWETQIDANNKVTYQVTKLVPR